MPLDFDALLRQLATLGGDFVIHAAPPASRRALAAAEKKLGAKLSREHRAIVERYGALAIVAKEQIWRRPVESEVCPAWRFAWAIEVLGIVPRGHPSSVDLVVQARAHAPSGRRRLVPAFQVAGTVYGYDRRGRMFAWSRETPPAAFEPARFFPALGALVETLRANTERAKNESAAASEAEERAAPAHTEHAILAGLASASAEERARAAGDARKLEPISPPVVRALVRALSDDEQDVRIAAAESLEPAADPASTDALLALLPRAKEHPRWFHRAEVGAILRALAASSPQDPRVVRAIVASLVVPDDHPYAALPAFEALRMIGRGAKSALPSLRELARSAHLWTRAQAHATLLAIEGKSKLHVKALFDLVVRDRERPSAGVEIVLADVLAELGARRRPLLREAAARPATRSVAKRLARALEEGG